MKAVCVKNFKSSCIPGTPESEASCLKHVKVNLVYHIFKSRLFGRTFELISYVYTRFILSC